MKIIPLILALTTSIAFSQGPLSPPGLPEPTMKTLDQIEARTPISSLPYIISTSGSYYFTTNLEFTETGGSNAIIIIVSGVTLDLNGFTLSSAPGVTGSGIHIGAGHSNVCVKNGHIVGKTTVNITGDFPARTWAASPGGFEYGINDLSTGTHFQNLGIRGCRASGLLSSPKGKCVVETVSATSNGYDGINVLGGIVSKCTAASNVGQGIYCIYGSVTDSSASDNGGTGTSVSHGSLSNSTALSNGDHGIYVWTGSASNSTARENGDNDLEVFFAAVAFCNAGTTMTFASTLTGNHFLP